METIKIRKTSLQFHIRIDVAQIVIDLAADMEVNMTCRPGQADAVIPINIVADRGQLIFTHSKGGNRTGHAGERDNEGNSIMFEHFHYPRNLTQHP